MTIQEYLSEHNMTQAQFSRMVGISFPAINKSIRHGSGFSKENVAKLKQFGVEAPVQRRGRVKGEHKNKKNKFDGFSYFEDNFLTQLSSVTEDVVYCWSKRQVDYVTQLLNSRKIAYYCYHKDCYWVVHYDKSLKCSEMD